LFFPNNRALRSENLHHSRSSGEYWTMGETLIQQCRVSEEGLRVVKLFRRWRWWL